ncbi:hypothetical protein [Actinoplanes sp. NPDC051494]|uniref:hypothetical protein n=1 Tax=Actinoplanes sp. NPDC051494 TaxID=3363907 RepID=UPI0037997996
MRLLTSFTARGVALVLAIAAGVVATVYAFRLADAGEPWASWRENVRTEGYLILVLSTAFQLAGALLHTPLVLARRGRAGWGGVGRGWLIVAALLAYHALIVVFAVWLSDFALGWGVVEGRRDAGAAYGALLSVLLFSVSLLGLTGVVFSDPVIMLSGLAIAFGFSLLVGAFGMADITLTVTSRYETSLIPMGGVPDLIIGLVVAVVAGALGTFGLHAQRTPGSWMVAAMKEFGVSPPFLFTGAGVAFAGALSSPSSAVFSAPPPPTRCP